MSYELEEDKWVSLPKVTRVDVNDAVGKAFKTWDKHNQVKVMLQDDGKTLVIFIENKEKGQ